MTRCMRCGAGVENITFSLLYIDYRDWYRYDATCKKCGKVWMHTTTVKIKIELEPEKVVFT